MDTTCTNGGDGHRSVMGRTMTSLSDAAHGAIKRYPVGTLLFAENDPGVQMYVIQEGAVKIFRHLGDTELVLAVLGSGDFFGEMALLEGQPRSASAIVVEEATLVEVRQSAFEEIIRRNSEIALRIMRKLSARIRDADRRIQYLMLESSLGKMLEVVRGLLINAVPEGSMFRVQGEVNLAQLAGLSEHAARSTMERLEHACIVQRRPDGALLIAGHKHLEEFGEYLDLKQKFDPLTASELASISGLSEEEVHQMIQHMLDSGEGQIFNGTPEEQTMYKRYLQLKKRFEYGMYV
jgi:CRP/FNR family transcriptional regulator, cyclic AMP receptor protein